MKTSATETLRILKRFFDAHGIVYWLDYGALLGAYRDGELIPWDKDIDIGIYKSQLTTIFIYLHELREIGFKTIHTPKLNSLQFIRDGTQIDIIVYEKKGPVWQCKWGYHATFLGKILNALIERLQGFYSKHGCKILTSEIPEKYFNYFKPLQFMGITWRIPAHTEDYLKLHYGKNWRIPKKDYYYADDDGAVIR